MSRLDPNRTKAHCPKCKRTVYLDEICTEPVTGRKACRRCSDTPPKKQLPLNLMEPPRIPYPAPPLQVNTSETTLSSNSLDGDFVIQISPFTDCSGKDIGITLNNGIIQRNYGNFALTGNKIHLLSSLKGNADSGNKVYIYTYPDEITTPKTHTDL